MQNGWFSLVWKLVAIETGDLSGSEETKETLQLIYGPVVHPNDAQIVLRQLGQAEGHLRQTVVAH